MPKKWDLKETEKLKAVIEDGITSRAVFSFAKKLKTVVIGKDVRKIGNGAFSYTRITSVKIPNKASAQVQEHLKTARN